MTIKRTIARTLRLFGGLSLFTLALTSVASATPTPSAEIMYVHTSPGVLPMGGGQAMIVGGMKNATTCQVKLLSHQGFPVVYATNVRPCTTTFTAKMTIGRNVSLINRTVAFVLIARNPTSVFRGYFFLTLKAATAKTVAAPTTTTPPTTTPPIATQPLKPPTTTPPNTGGASVADLQASVDNTMEPDQGALNQDFDAITNCFTDNGGEEGCESYGSQYASDAQSDESDTPAPMANVQAVWETALSDQVNVGNDYANDDDPTADLSQGSADMQTLVNVISAYGIPASSL